MYLRHLEVLRAEERPTVSSRQLGSALGISDAQVRKDLAYFGQFGHPGVGYRVKELMLRIRQILGTDRKWNVVLVGAGNLGRALVCYRGFSKKGFNIVSVFDSNPKLVGTVIDAKKKLFIEPMEDLAACVKRRKVQLAMIAVPATAAQQVAQQVLAAGIRGILNFAPVTLHTNGAALAAVDLAVHLEQLSFQLATDEG